jgi:uncharacterized protein involved in exopolysaccharide biosynthesis
MEDLNSPKINTNNLFEFFWNHKIKLILISGFVGAASLVISFFLPEIFKASYIFFPTKTNSVNIMGESRYSGTSFGEEEEAEQMLQILESNSIREKVINEFQLIKHYEIDTSKAYWQTKLQKSYENNISSKRTKYGSIQIDVFDESPDTCALIANTIGTFVDSVMNQMIRVRVSKEFEVVDREYKRAQEELKELTTQLTTIADSGVVSQEERVALIRAQSEAMNRKDQKAIDYYTSSIRMNQKHGSLYDGLNDERQAKVKLLADLKLRWQQAKSDSEINIAQTFVLNKALVPDKKTYPKKLLIGVIGSLSTFIGLLLLLLVKEKVKELKAKN